MNKTKTLAKTYDITKNLYYDHSLYEHDHKETHPKDIKITAKVSLIERRNKVAANLIENGILYNT